MDTSKSIISLKFLKCSLVFAVLSQILVPIYSDRNFMALGEGGQVHQICLEDTLNYPSDTCKQAMARSNLYDSLFYTIHFYFGDLGLLILQVFVVLLITLVLSRILMRGDSEHQHFRFFLYLISLISMFYGRDISPDHFVLLGVLIFIWLLSGLVRKDGPSRRNEHFLSGIMRAILMLYMFVIAIGLWDESFLLSLFDGDVKNLILDRMFKGPVGEDLSVAIYSLAANIILLVIAFFTLNRELLRIAQVLFLCFVFALSLISPLMRMIFPVLCLLVIFKGMDTSVGLRNISAVLKRFTLVFDFVPAYSLVFFLLAYSFSQADGAFKYPLTTLFMPVERVDKLIAQNLCLGEENGFTREDFARYSGYLKYREVYSKLQRCS